MSESPTSSGRPPATAACPAAGPRRPYRPPRLTAHGGLLTLTLGSSPGVGDSLNPAETRSPI
ncbi:MAG TPA: hypothetical protein VHQ65_16085 [Thermoanaerobaculia bacterium]|nr:hypothetical protein [Thermoanaerobaculia bacterium]